MTHGGWLASAWTAALLASGCLGEYRPAPRSEGAQSQKGVTRAVGASQAPAQGGASPAVPGPTPPAPSGPEAPSPTGPASAGVATLPPPIQLTLGCALAQTGPEGTMMLFSVGYEFVRGEPLSSAGYAWVIRRGGGAPARIHVRLDSKGELSTFQPWRPEEGPFQAHLEDAGKNQLSNTIDLR